jgi:glycerol-3-phosphate dehydrogenase
VKLRHEIIGAFWNEEEGLWHVKVRRIETSEEFEDTAEILINGGGILKYVFLRTLRFYVNFAKQLEMARC